MLKSPAFSPFGLFILLAVIISFPLFYHLDYLPFRLWDESVLGVNVLEMMHNHNYIVTYFYEYPDMYRCKPPLMLWIMIPFIKLFGFSELTLRLPAALSAMALCFYLFFTLKKITGNYLFGFFAVCVLVTCRGYIGVHITRTGEYDSFWLLCVTIFALSIFQAVDSDDKKLQFRHLLVGLIFATLALLTKGIACLLQFLPGLLIYVAMRQQILMLLKNKGFYIGIGIFLVFGMGYYFLRESMNPGYLKAVWNHEMQFHFADAGLGIDGPFVKRFPYLFFLKAIVTSQFLSYLFIFPIALYVGYRYADAAAKQIIVFAMVVGFSFLLVISLIAKKMYHYDAALFVYLSIIMGSFFYVLYTAILNLLAGYNLNARTATVIAVIAVLSIMGKPYYDIVNSVYLPNDNWEGPFSETSKYFQRAARGQVDLKPYKLIYDAKEEYGPGMVLTCYAEELREKGEKLWLANSSELAVNDKAILFDSINKQLVARKFEIDTLEHLGYCNADIVYIKGRKPNL